MAKMISNSELVKTIKKQGFATEQQINLIKRRINKRDESASEMFNLLGEVMPIKLTAEQTAKGREWLLRKNLKYNGQLRKNATLPENEIRILKDAKTEAYLSGFYDLGNGYITNNVPIYRYKNENVYFEYYVQFGDVHQY